MADDRLCQFIVGFKMEPGEDGDPIFCGRFAPIRTQSGDWLCAEHYDECMAELQKRVGKRAVL